MHRTGGDRGNAELDLRIKGIGRFRLSTETKRASVHARRKALVKLLVELGQVEVLKSLKAGEITWSLLEHAQRQQRLADGSLGSHLKLQRNLGEAIAETLPRMGPSEATRDRYRVGLGHLHTLGVWTDTAIVADLKRDDWTERLEQWPVAAATKNGVRTSVSRFLTRYLGDKFDPFRRAVLHEDRWKPLKVPPRVRGIAAEDFWPLMRAVPERLVPSYVILAATGMRVGEYLRDADLVLDPAHHTISVRGKTGPKVYALAPSVWSWVPAAIPCKAAHLKKVPRRLQDDARYKVLRESIAEAGRSLGVTVTCHDLRRLFVRLGVDAMGETATQHAVGHETPAMTREYARWRSQGEVAAAVADSLGLGSMSGKKSGNTPLGDGSRRRLRRPQRIAEAG